MAGGQAAPRLDSQAPKIFASLVVADSKKSSDVVPIACTFWQTSIPLLLGTQGLACQLLNALNKTSNLTNLWSSFQEDAAGVRMDQTGL